MTITLTIRGGFTMTFLKILGAIVLVFWLLGLIFRLGGYMINILLLVAAIVFIVDTFSNKNKHRI